MRGVGAVEAGVDVSGAGDFEAGKAFERSGVEGGEDLLGDDFGGLAECARKLEGDGSGELAELEVGGNLDGDVLQFDLKCCFENGAEMIGEAVLQFEIHVGKASKMLDFTR